MDPFAFGMEPYSPCNYCNYRDLVKRVARQGLEVTVLTDKDGWANVYAHPPEVNVSSLTEEERKPYCKAGFMRLPDHCCC